MCLDAENIVFTSSAHHDVDLRSASYGMTALIRPRDCHSARHYGDTAVFICLVCRESGHAIVGIQARSGRESLAMLACFYIIIRPLTDDLLRDDRRRRCKLVPEYAMWHADFRAVSISHRVTVQLNEFYIVICFQLALTFTYIGQFLD